MRRCLEVPAELVGSLLELADGVEHKTGTTARAIVCTDFEQTFEKWRALLDRLSHPVKEVDPPPA